MGRFLGIMVMRCEILGIELFISSTFGICLFYLHVVGDVKQVGELGRFFVKGLDIGKRSDI